MTDSAITRPAPELLAPAGDWDCVRAAIENGADAVYFGLETGFNARARATNFALADLPRLMHMLHLRGLKGYATLNTLVFSDEVKEFARVVEAVAVFVTLKGGEPDDVNALKDALRKHVRQQIGALAAPDDIHFTNSLPKTRSGKIMRRLLRDIAAGKETVGDTSTLEDYTVLAKLRGNEE